MKQFLSDFFYWYRRGYSLKTAWRMASKTL